MPSAAYLPGAEQVWVLRDSGVFPSQRIHADGFFEAVFPNETQVFRYRLRARYGEGNEPEFEDPYRFPPILSDFDLYLLGEGTHYKSYEKLGAHVMEVEGVRRRGLCRVGSERAAGERGGEFQ